MTRYALVAAALLLAASSGPAIAGAGNFTLVNATGHNMASVSIRRYGSDAWQRLAAAPAAGAQAAVQFSDTDCAFDLRADLAGGGSAVWGGVNLCEAKVVTLNRDGSGAVWVDYD